MLRCFASLLALFCLMAVARVEFLDHQAGGAIQRKMEQEPDSKWRISGIPTAERSPGDRLGMTLKTWGVGLHGAAMLLVLLSLFRQAHDGPWKSGWTAFAVLGMALLVWALYRQYFAALGW